VPTLQAEEFCEAFYTWANACQTELPADDEDRKQWRKEFADHWSFMELAIHKSCLLDRLIYAREPLRKKCAPCTKANGVVVFGRSWNVVVSSVQMSQGG
jgi:hypothetical protein